MGHVNSMRTGSTAFEALLYQEARRCIWTELLLAGNVMEMALQLGVWFFHSEGVHRECV